ncbi:MAG: hypothetical protein JEZ00_13340 [Anaerolineaceae bacterium]|nr:hypothetical protein [Anaerolineaceae bacterium]
MNSENLFWKIGRDIPGSNGRMDDAVLYLFPFIVPIIYKAIDKLEDFTHDAMEHRYDIKVKVGPIDIAITKNNL